jgi:Ca-activated chloride channel family protein
MQITAHLDVNVVAVETDDRVAVMLDLAAPVVAVPHERASATLQVVLDRSGSMDGARLHGAVEALCALVARLDSRDNFGVVVFDHVAEVVVPAGPLTDKPAAISALRGVVARGATDLSAGYLRGLQEAKRVAEGRGGTVLLISDGHANQGVTEAVRLEGLARSAAGERIVTSTLGYGVGYDETLLVGLARGGSGNHHFAADPDGAGALIAGEATELLSKSVQAASVMIDLDPTVTMLQLFNDLPVTELAAGRLMVEVGDFYSGEQRRLVLQLGVPAMAALGLATIATISVRFVELPALRSTSCPSRSRSTSSRGTRPLGGSRMHPCGPSCCSRRHNWRSGKHRRRSSVATASPPSSPSREPTTCWSTRWSARRQARRPTWAGSGATSPRCGSDRPGTTLPSCRSCLARRTTVTTANEGAASRDVIGTVRSGHRGDAPHLWTTVCTNRVLMWTASLAL